MGKASALAVYFYFLPPGSVLMLSEQCHFYFFQYAILIGFLHSRVLFYLVFGGMVKKKKGIPSWEQIFNLML